MASDGSQIALMSKQKSCSCSCYSSPYLSFSIQVAYFYVVSFLGPHCGGCYGPYIQVCGKFFMHLYQYLNPVFHLQIL